MMQINFKDIFENGVTIYSSGTSGKPSPYFQSPDKLTISSRVAAVAQGIRSSSKVYTCCKTTHAGGLLAQTLPALAVGAKVDIVNFSAYDFVRDINNYTHTHITPRHAKAIMATKGFQTLNLSGVSVTCGADPVTWDIIEAFVSKGAKFIANWGMSEVGPIAINIVFEDLDEVHYLKESAPANSTIMGRNKHCHYKVVNGELWVKGDICIYDGWYPTRDQVVVQNDILYYVGRTNKEIDIWNPQKG